MESTLPVLSVIIAAGGFAIAMLGGMIHIVWVLSRMRAQLDQVLLDIESNELGAVVKDHGERLARLEARCEERSAGHQRLEG